MPSAGAKIRASDNATVIIDAYCTADTTLGAEADVTGCTITFTTVHANAKVKVDGVGWFTSSAFTTLGDAYLRLTVDGVNQSRTSVIGCRTASDSLCAKGTWSFTLAAAGSHTIKMRCTKASGTWTGKFIATHTAFTGIVLDVA